MDEPIQSGRIQKRGLEEFIRPFIESRFPHYIDSIKGDLQSELEQIPTDGKILEIGVGRGDLTRATATLLHDQQQLDIAEQDTRALKVLMESLDSSIGEKVHPQDLRKINETYDLILMHNPDGSLLDLSTPSSIKSRLTSDGRIVIYRDYPVDEEGIRKQNYFDFQKDKSFDNNDLFTRVEQFTSHISASGSAGEILDFLTDANSTVGQPSTMQPKPVRTNNIDMFKGHIYEWARITQIYELAGFSSIETTYHSTEEIVPTTDLDTIMKPPLSSEVGYVYHYIGGAELIFEDTSVPAGQVKKIFSTQKITITQ